MISRSQLSKAIAFATLASVPLFAKADIPSLPNTPFSPITQVSTFDPFSKPAPCQVGPIIGGHFVPLNLRLGAELSPRTKFDGGVDLDVPGVHFGRGSSARIDFDAIVSANFGGVSTLFPLTFDLIYHPAFVGIHNPYLGFGIGPYFGERTRFGGKIVFGANFTRDLGLEGAVHFAGYGPALFTLQVRFPL
ncbi:hypothetical protein [Chthonomonas calidirosea]|uniref:hypothetical protein n=1 Tax=Chthonomonas calidirosea TaxID=454171 RepID=UPI0006EC9589|nr:hypothetical protein [Chthonomonas calidirosea]CEK12532.1 hypothetical protein CP488_00074 [Chthonomonas calidirosea]